MDRKGSQERVLGNYGTNEPTRWYYNKFTLGKSEYCIPAWSVEMTPRKLSAVLLKLPGFLAVK